MGELQGYKAIQLATELVNPIPDPEVWSAYECPYESCNESFSDRQIWIHHIPIHSGKRPHCCFHPGCQKRFSRSDKLAHHRKTHTPLEEAPVLQPLSWKDHDALVASPVDSDDSLDSPSPLENKVRQSTRSRPSYVTRPSPCRERSASVESTGSRGSVASGNSDPKAVCEDLPNFFETSQVYKHWSVGTTILQWMKGIAIHLDENQDKRRLDLTTLREVMKRLSSATQEVTLNGKAWSAIGTALSRHLRDLKSSSTSHKISSAIQEYTMVLKDILALWIRTVDPSIDMPYEALPSHQKPRHFSIYRYGLFLLAQQHGVGLIDEDVVYEQKNRLEDTFKAILDSQGQNLQLSESSPLPKEEQYADSHRRSNSFDGQRIGTLTATPLDFGLSTSRKRPRNGDKSDHEADGHSTKRRKTATS